MKQRSGQGQEPEEARTSFGDYDLAEAKAFLQDAESLTEMEVDSDEKHFLVVWKKPDGAIWIENERRDAVAAGEDDDYTLTLRVPAGATSPVELMEYEKDVLVRYPAVKVETGGMVDFHFLEDGNLRVVANRGLFEHFDIATGRKHGEEEALQDVMCDYLQNGWALVDCYAMAQGAFSITNEGGYPMDSGEISYYPYCWDQTYSYREMPLQALVETGFVHFTRNEPTEWMDADAIRDWKRETNEDRRNSDGDEDRGDLWPLDEVPAAEGLRATAATAAAAAATADDLPEGVTISDDIAKMEQPKWNCALIEVQLPDGEHLRGFIQGSGGKLGAGIAHSKKPALIALSAAETLEAAMTLAAKGKPLSDSMFFSVYEPKPGHVALTQVGDRDRQIDIPLAGSRFKIVEV